MNSAKHSGLSQAALSRHCRQQPSPRRRGKQGSCYLEDRRHTCANAGLCTFTARSSLSRSTQPQDPHSPQTGTNGGSRPGPSQAHGPERERTPPPASMDFTCVCARHGEFDINVGGRGRAAPYNSPKRSMWPFWYISFLHF